MLCISDGVRLIASASRYANCNSRSRRFFSHLKTSISFFMKSVSVIVEVRSGISLLSAPWECWNNLDRNGLLTKKMLTDCLITDYYCLFVIHLDTYIRRNKRNIVWTHAAQQLARPVTLANVRAIIGYAWIIVSITQREVRRFILYRRRRLR